MKGGSVRTLEDEVLIQALQDQLPPLYKEPSSYTEGGGRHVFQAEWGGRKTRTRAIKVDKTPQEITSPRAARYFERNYNSEHELNIANHVAHPENHNLLMPIDGGKIVIDGQTRFWTSEPFVNSTQLNTYIQEHEDGLPAHEIKQLFTDYTHAYKVLEEHRVLHRDGSGRNFLVELDDNKDVKGWVTDWGNAGTAENIESKILPTAGAREVMDPTLIFQGETASYDHRSEQFAIGTLLYKALTGKEIFDINPDTEYNPETRQNEQPYVRSAQTQQNLLFPNNTLDTLAAQKTVDTALKELLYERPVEYFKYKDVLSSTLSIDRSNRYESLEELASYFSSAANFSNLKLNLHLTKWLTIAGVGAMMLVHTNGIQEELWQNTPLSLNNNINSELQYQNELFSAHAIISDEGTPEEIELQTAVSTEHLLAQPQSQHTLHVAYELHEPGVDRIDPFGTFNSHSRISSKGKVYIEELEDEHEFSRGVTYNKYPSRAGYLPVYTSKELTAPDTHPRIYSVATEVSDVDTTNKYLETFRGDDEKLLNRRLTHMIVGDLEEDKHIELGDITTNGQRQTYVFDHLTQPGAPITDKITYELLTPTTKYAQDQIQIEKHSREHRITTPQLPHGEHPLAIVGRDQQNNILFTHFTIQGIDTTNNSAYQASLPDNFKEYVDAFTQRMNQ